MLVQITATGLVLSIEGVESNHKTVINTHRANMKIYFLLCSPHAMLVSI